ncbi:MAG: family 43 glycosylhydrolase, partial [Clostridiales bacterium]|nr:family 43 glycosylhydrolase [Clostridiales bacterium]
MKKLSRMIVVFVAALFVAAFATGCGGKKSYYAIPYYDCTQAANDAVRYNRELFRYNDGSITAADPSVLYVNDAQREDNGCFYLYGTFPAVEAYTAVTYRSRDLVNWEWVGPVFSDAVKTSGLFRTEVYAPKVIADNGKYYMFVSATPDMTSSTTKNVTGLLYLLSSDNPYGPFDFVDFSAQNRATSYQDQANNRVQCSDYWASRMYFDTAKYAARVMELEQTVQN